MKTPKDTWAAGSWRQLRDEADRLAKEADFQKRLAERVAKRHADEARDYE